MRRLRIQGLTDVSETLLLPLYYRARESQEPQPLISDSKAVQLVQEIDYDFGRFKKLGNEQVAAAVRVRVIDRCAQSFLEQHPDGVIVNIGCGLDTRYYRMDNGRAEWYELDLPAVIELRSQLVEVPPRTRLLAHSALELEWMDEVHDLGRACLLTAEGVFPYFAEKDVKRLVCALQTRFPQGELVFDVLSPLMNRLHNIELALARVPARLRWGLDDPKALEAWSPGIVLLGDWTYFDQPEARLRGLRLMRHIPFLNNSARILHYQLNRV